MGSSEKHKTDQIIGSISGKAFSVRTFIRENLNGILGTLAFHMVLLILFLLIKIQTFREINDLDLVFDYTEPPLTEEQLLAIQEEEQKEAYYERLLRQQLRLSNQASNVGSDIEQKISTDNYVNEVLKQLDESRSEEWKKEQEKIAEMLKEAEREYLAEEPEEEKAEDFQGPTTITYRFLVPPLERRALNMPVPVYKCRGGGTVEVSVTVNQLGQVTSAKAEVLNASHDPECLAEVARRYALLSRFSGSTNAPGDHPGVIRYEFVAQ